MRQIVRFFFLFGRDIAIERCNGKTWQLWPSCCIWQEISPFLCNVNMGQFNLVHIPIFFALLHARLKCLGLQRWMEEELRKLRRLWPQYGLIVWRRCNRFESFIPSSFFIAKENHDYLKHVLLVTYCSRIRLQAIPQVTFAQSHLSPSFTGSCFLDNKLEFFGIK